MIYTCKDPRKEQFGITSRQILSRQIVEGIVQVKAMGRRHGRGTIRVLPVDIVPGRGSRSVLGRLLISLERWGSWTECRGFDVGL